jgi:hypothetical protein
MTQVNISIPLPKPAVEFFSKEARRRTRAEKKFVSRSSIMREVLADHIAKAAPCPPIPSAKTPQT